MTHNARIFQLSIERFRGIESLKWNPSSGLNLILGGGDVGKTTILEAIALLLSPSSGMILTEADYWRRNTDAGFVIRAVLSLPKTSDISQQAKFAWPWEWNGNDPVPPPYPQEENDKSPDPGQPVYCIRVCGTPELEINWEIIQPSDETDPLSVAIRRQIGLVRLIADERNDRDLRLVYGSALDRLLADKGLRGRIGVRLADFNLQQELSPDAQTALSKLDDTLKKETLPHNLELGLTSSQGLSIGALTGLFAEKTDQISLPLASWGTGTRRMTTLQIAAATESTTHITVVDELERGLESYRVRKLVAALQSGHSQSFATTHNAVAINAADGAELWYLDATGNIGALPRARINQMQARDPETFLSRLAIVCEGQTEIGFVAYLLECAFDDAYRDHGIHLADGQGNESTLSLLEVVTNAGLGFAGFADNEGLWPTKWETLKSKMKDRLFQWQSGCLEENILGLTSDNKLIEFIKDNDGELDGNRLRTLADRLGTTDKDLETLSAAIQSQEKDLRTLIVQAATGNSAEATEGQKKEWRSHAKLWFKSEAGGRELATKVFAINLWPKLRPQLLPFLNAIRAACGQDILQDLPHE